MGRIPGVTAEETRARVLRGAATVFAQQGYEGASITDLAAEAGVSSGALYAHFGSKAGLFGATLRAYASTEVERLLTVGGPGADIVRLLRERGVALARRPEDRSLLLAGIIAAPRHPDVAAELISAFSDREEQIAELVRAGQRSGDLDDEPPPAAVARFVTMLVMGSVLVSAMELPEVDEREWSDFITDLVDRYQSRT